MGFFLVFRGVITGGLSREGCQGLSERMEGVAFVYQFDSCIQVGSLKDLCYIRDINYESEVFLAWGTLGGVDLCSGYRVGYGNVIDVCLVLLSLFAVCWMFFVVWSVEKEEKSRLEEELLV